MHMQGFLNEAINTITLTIARRTARRAQLYMRIYMTGMAHSHDLIKKFVNIHKCHRNILDQETKYLEKLVVLCQAHRLRRCQQRQRQQLIGLAVSNPHQHHTS